MVRSHDEDHPPRSAEVRLTQETIDFLEQRMTAAVRAGITEAINEETAERFWAAGIQVLQRRTSEHAGRFVVGGIIGVIRKLGTFLLLGGLVYAVGGWQALAGLAKLLAGRP